MGSPPPTRGTPFIPFAMFAYFRITPAYAGNTTKPVSQTTNIQDHPRLRGEHTAISLISLDGLGSPPPTRGTLIKNLG